MGGDRESELDAIGEAYEALVADCVGVLRFGGDEQALTIKFTPDNETGRLVSSVPVAALLAVEHVLFVPDERDGALQLMLSPDEMEECAATDRWQAYHGAPEHVRWGAFWIDSARYGSWVLDGEALMSPNVLAKDEPALCRRLNEDQGRLAAICQRYAGVVVPSPVCVGVDGGGLHVRARFGVVRVRFEKRVRDRDEAMRVIERMSAGP